MPPKYKRGNDADDSAHSVSDSGEGRKASHDMMHALRSLAQAGGSPLFEQLRGLIATHASIVSSTEERQQLKLHPTDSAALQVALDAALASECASALESDTAPVSRESVHASHAQTEPVAWLCDACVLAFEHGALEASTTFSLIGDVLRCTPLVHAHTVFDFVSTRVAALSVLLPDPSEHAVAYGNGAALASNEFAMRKPLERQCFLPLVRACNDASHRASRLIFALLRGAIHVHLMRAAHVTEQSSMNVKGHHNTANYSQYDSLMEQGDSTGTAIAPSPEGTRGENNHTSDRPSPLMDPKLYATFWELINLLRKDNELTAGPRGGWHKAKKALSTVLETMETFGTENIEIEHAQSEIKESDGSAKSVYKSRYSTEWRMFPAQMTDKLFRRTVLIQILVVLHALADPNAPASADTGDAEEVQQLSDRAKNLLAQSQRHGAHTDELVANVLHREAEWFNLKHKKLEQLLLEKTEIPKALPRRRLAARVYNKRKLGKQALDTLWAEELPNQERNGPVPTLEQMMERVVDDEDPSAGIEEDYKGKHSKLFMFRLQRKSRRVAFHRSRQISTLRVDGVAEEVTGRKIANAENVKSENDAADQAERENGASDAE